MPNLEQERSKPKAPRMTLDEFSRGDPAAFARAYPSLVRFAGKLMGNMQDEAEDLVQTALSNAVGTLGRRVSGDFVGKDNNVMPYLYTAIRNERINQVRSRGRMALVERVEALGEAPERTLVDPLQDVEGTIVQRERSAEVHSNLATSVKSDFRDVVLLADLHNLRYKEIAERLGLPIGTVMSRIHRGRKEARKALQNT